ncbi:MAG: hypothetical protein AAB955_02970 [Patescibacteria group bacterium]
MKWEGVAVMLLGASFFVGIWYALPMVNTITDVWAFGGGVLRALEAHSLFPGGDVSYGTLSFYQNYVLMVLALVVGFLFVGFDVEVLKTILVLNPSYSLLVPRLASALTSIAFLVIVYRFLRTQVTDAWWRFALLVLVFGNVLTALLVRSGKMWILSIMLATTSFIYLYRTLIEERQRGIPGRLALISVVTAFLATANFPFAVVFLITIPIIFVMYPKTMASLSRQAGIVAVGVTVFLGITLLNFDNTVTLIWDYAAPLLGTSAVVAAGALPQLSFLGALWVNLLQAGDALVLLLLALGAVLLTKIRDKTLAYLALIYMVVYILAASLVFRSDQGLALNIRHIFPICFLLLFLIVAYGAPLRRVSVIFLSIGLAVYVYTIVLLSIPTTYNAASDFITERYGDKEVIIYESIFELTLPTNKASFELYDVKHCGSTCQHRLAQDIDIPFRPIVVTSETNADSLQKLPPDLVVVERATLGCTPVARFGSPVPDDEVFDIDINLGRMLLPSFYRLHQLGKNIYIYEPASCPNAQ